MQVKDFDPFRCYIFLNNPEYYRASPCCWPRSWWSCHWAHLSVCWMFIEFRSVLVLRGLHARNSHIFPTYRSGLYFRMEIGYFLPLGGGSHNDPKFLGLIIYQQFQASFFSTRNFWNRHTFRKGVMTKNDWHGDFTAQSGALGGNGFFSTPVPKHWCFWENGLDFAVLHMLSGSCSKLSR